MDLSFLPKASIMKESLCEETTDQQSIKSSSSSIYSSPTTTPTATSDPQVVVVGDAPDGSLQHEVDQEHAEQPSKPPEAAKAYYEDLIQESKLRMTNKFIQLEKETGLVLAQDGLGVENGDSNGTLGSHSNCLPKSAPPTETKALSNFKGLEYVCMEKELKRLKEELNLKNEIVDKMFKIRSQVECELEDLTVSLFGVIYKHSIVFCFELTITF